MSDMHNAARDARKRTKPKLPLSLLWLLIALIVFALSAAIDMAATSAPFWFGAEALMRGAIGAVAALIVVLLAHTARFLLTRRDASSPPDEGTR